MKVGKLGTILKGSNTEKNDNLGWEIEEDRKSRGSGEGDFDICTKTPV